MVDADLRALALVNLGIAELWTGALDGAEHHLERARGAAAEAGHDWVVLIAVAHLAVLAGDARTTTRARPGTRARRSRSPSGTAGSGPGRPARRTSRSAAAQFLWDRGDEAARDDRARARGARRHAGAAAARRARAAALAACSATAASPRRRWPWSRPAPRSWATSRCSPIDPRPLRDPRGDAARRARRPRAGGAPARRRRRQRARRRCRNAVVLAQLQLADGEPDDRARDARAVVGRARASTSPSGVQALRRRRAGARRRRRPRRRGRRRSSARSTWPSPPGCAGRCCSSAARCSRC